MFHHAATDLAYPYSIANQSSTPSGVLDIAPPSSQFQTNMCNDSNFVVEEISDSDETYPEGVQILHPYELEEADSGTENAGCNSTTQNNYANHNDYGNEDGEDTQDSDTVTSPRHIPRLRWYTASGPVFASPSPSRANKRKRLRSEAFDTDADSETSESARNPSGPPRSRRRVQTIKDSHLVALGKKPSFASTEAYNQPGTLPGGDPMDIDSQTVSA